MHQTIKDIRKDISNIYNYLTVDENEVFLNQDCNKPTNANNLELAEQLNVSKTKSRVLLNALSNAIEDTAVYRSNLRFAICKEKSLKKERKRREEK